ncbi:hypothetical protein GNP84_19905 [Aliivibrio fischeri]|uniref:hypothetical protein n=1 Tax=Aliivibrio fischeri TaxID=668 RepID=UPI0012D8AA30|nr:hypothetical protein [Aliivibrio fischeri]MUK79140.1 hypothetical protein [Aliivibrio fischeri]
MKLNNIALHEFFREKSITHLHHANTVATSISFILSGGLLSRGDIERRSLTQTIQASDDEDKEFNVWDDVFLDTADLHGYFPRQNLYGPVLFKLNIAFLLEDNVDVWITKDNPMYWTSSVSTEDRYFQSVDELRAKWNQYDRQKKMITIRKPGRPVLFSSLEEITIDDPRIQIYGDTHVANEMIKALSSAIQHQPELQGKIKLRECNGCYCRNNYLYQVSTEQSARLFLPKEHSHFPDRNT